MAMVSMALKGMFGRGGVGETDHAHGGGKKEQEPACGFGTVDTKSEPGERESGQKRGDCAWQAGRGFADAKV